VELAQQQVLPELVDLVLRIRIRFGVLGDGAKDGRERGGKLEVVEEDLALAVVALDRAVRRSRAAARRI
jgi:hypothetical protein